MARGKEEFPSFIGEGVMVRTCRGFLPGGGSTYRQHSKKGTKEKQLCDPYSSLVLTFKYS